LRFRLWQAGYQSSEEELPGLLAQEEESLKVYLTILFKQHFAQKKAGRSSPKLFDLYSKVLKDYVFKHSELVSIGSSGDKFIPSMKAMSEEEVSMLHKGELEKQISHQSKVIHQVILENLLRLSDEDLHKEMGDLGQLLIDLTVCHDFKVRSKNHQLLSRIFEYLQAKAV